MKEGTVRVRFEAPEGKTQGNGGYYYGITEGGEKVWVRGKANVRDAPAEIKEWEVKDQETEEDEDEEYCECGDHFVPSSQMLPNSSDCADCCSPKEYAEAVGVDLDKIGDRDAYEIHRDFLQENEKQDEKQDDEKVKQDDEQEVKKQDDERDEKNLTEDDDGKGKIPTNFLCPITGLIMEYPHFTMSGHSYEHEAINNWINIQGKRTDPMTGARLQNTALIPNHNLRSQIQDWIQKHQEIAGEYRNTDAKNPNEDEKKGKGEEEKGEEYNLWEAVRTNNLPLAKQLISDMKVNVNQVRGGDSLLHLAVEKDSKDMVKFLIGASANIEAKTHRGNDTPLHLASRFGRKDIAKILIEAGANIEAKDRWGGWTPLHLAIIYNPANYDVAKLLLEAGADKEAKDNNGNTPGEEELWEAVNTNNLPLAQQLISDMGVNVNGGNRLLHRAIFKDSKDMVKYLIEAGADIEAKIHRGNCTPLHFASRFGRKDIAKILIEAGADYDARDKFGYTPLVIARICGHSETASLLENIYNN